MCRRPQRFHLEADSRERRCDERHGMHGPDGPEPPGGDRSREHGEIGSGRFQHDKRAPCRACRPGGDAAIRQMQFGDEIARPYLGAVGESDGPATVTPHLDPHDQVLAERSNAMPPQVEALPPQPHLQDAASVAVTAPAARDQPPQRGRYRVSTEGRGRGHPPIVTMRSRDRRRIVENRPKICDGWLWGGAPRRMTMIPGIEAGSAPAT